MANRDENPTELSRSIDPMELPNVMARCWPINAFGGRLLYFAPSLSTLPGKMAFGIPPCSQKRRLRLPILLRGECPWRYLGIRHELAPASILRNRYGSFELGAFHRPLTPDEISLYIYPTKGVVATAQRRILSTYCILRADFLASNSLVFTH